MNALIEIASDVICPWCYIGKRRFEKALELISIDAHGACMAPSIGGESIAASRATANGANEMVADSGALGAKGIDVVWRPFQLNPDMPKSGVERDEYRVKKFGSLEHSRQLDAQIAEAGRGVGIQFNHAAMKRTPNTFDSHRLLGFAAGKGNQNELAEVLFRGYFCEGRDIGERSTLAELAASVGMDSQEVEQFLASDLGTEETKEEEHKVKALGIQGVPSFIFNGRVLFSGAQSPDVIAKAISQL